MKKNILYLLSSYNRFSGTPKKTFDLIKHSEQNSFLYVWSTSHSDDFKMSFQHFCKKVFEGNFGRNIIKHKKKLIQIVDDYKIDIVQTQFFFGELLAGFLKHYRPHVKVIVTFEGSQSAGIIKRTIQKRIYKKFQSFIYISNYVKDEKEEVFPYLKTANSQVIYNGAKKRNIHDNFKIKLSEGFNLLSVSSLIEIKNIGLLLEMMLLLKKEHHTDIHLYIVGDGALRQELENRAIIDEINDNVHFLGKQKNVGNLLAASDVLVHPCYIEAFGLSVVEGMLANRPVLVANSGAFPEMLEHKKTGFLADPFDAKDWKKYILKIKDNIKLAQKVSKKGRIKAETEYSIENYIQNYQHLYKNI